jgi:hypothetical protein
MNYVLLIWATKYGWQFFCFMMTQKGLLTIKLRLGFDGIAEVSAIIITA